MQELLGYVFAVLIGISLGMIGGGGSIITVPVVVYLFGIPPITATSYSLFIVGCTSLVGAVRNWRKNLVDLRTAWYFGLPSIIIVFLIRRYVIPSIPSRIGSIGSYEISYPFLTMVLFAILMLFSALAMIRSHDQQKAVARQRRWKLLIYGIAIGIVTGFLGAGGGFLLIPALVFIMGLGMKEAIGTSLLIIAMNSLVGFAGDSGLYEINWELLGIITTLAVGGIFIGSFFSHKVQAAQLKKIFGWFVLSMAVYVLIKEFLLTN